MLVMWWVYEMPIEKSNILCCGITNILYTQHTVSLSLKKNVVLMSHLIKMVGILVLANITI